MNIEVCGVGFANKGAELMLHSIVEELSRSCPDAVLAMDSKVASYKDRARLGLYQKPPRSEWGFASWLMGLLWRRKTRERYGVVLASQIDVILDASGFKYSDQGGPRGTERLAKKAKNWKARGKKVVLLPQALGPFESERIRKAFLEVVEHVDLIFPRDRDSYDHVVRLVGKRDHIRLRPDFTNLMKGKVPENFSLHHPRACLIPNTRMLEKTEAKVREAYLPFLAKCALFLRDTGFDPFVLIHETGNDRVLAEEVKRLSGTSLDIVEEMDPVHIKGIIGNSYLVVGSRFHGLVSALSQGVPAVATGWSHKYQMLYEEYGCPDLLIADLEFESEGLPRLKRLIDEDSRREIIRTLKESARIQVQKSERMWQEVAELICSP